MPAAARVTDAHDCPKYNGPVPHIGGPVATGSGDVIIENHPAARVGDPANCVGVGATDPITAGSASVFINGLPAARQGDATEHGGVITSGAATVNIGDAGGNEGFIGEVIDPTKHHWIEVELKDEQGEPIGYEPVDVTIPDGRVIRRRLNKNGLARIRGIDPGVCKVVYPELGIGSTEATSTTALPIDIVDATRPGTIEFEVQQPDGSPAAGRYYQVTLPDGTLRSGQLNAQGLLRIEGVDPGTCTIKLIAAGN